MYDISDATGLCNKDQCKGDGVASVGNDTNLCLFHFAEEMGLVEAEARRYLKELRIIPFRTSTVPPSISSSAGLGKAESVAALGM